MARKANTDATIVTTADDLHANDYLIGKDGQRLIVETVRKRSGNAVITLWDGKTYTVPADRLVKVHTEHECDCGGTGRFRWAGATVNGVWEGKEGPHYACAGKGWQDRSDVIRNSVYWNKYARFHAYS